MGYSKRALASLSSTSARFLTVALLALALLEGLRSVNLHRGSSSTEDFEALAAKLEQDTRPVIAHRPWFAPLLKARLPAAARSDSWAAPDRAGWPEYWTIAHRSDPEHLEENPTAQAVENITFGALVARRWKNPQANKVIASLNPSLPAPKSLRAQQNDQACKVYTRDGLKIRCPDQSRMEWGLAEIDYRPRQCLAFTTNTLAPVELLLELPYPKRGGELRLRAGFSDFNARLRSDAALQVRLRHGKETWLDRPVSDAQGWALWQRPLPPSSDAKKSFQLELRLQLSAAQTSTPSFWRAITPCIDLRVLERPA